MFNIMNLLSADGHTVMPFSIHYNQNAETPYSKYFVESLGTRDEVYFDQHRKSPQAFLKTLLRLFYSTQVESGIARMVEETQPSIAYVLCYLRKLSPALLVGLKKKGVPIVVRLSDYGMFCPEQHCFRNSSPCTLCIGGNLLHSIRYKCVKQGYSISLVNALATWYHRYKGFFDLIDVFVTTNPFMEEMMIKAGYPKERLCCIPTFTDTGTFYSVEELSNSGYILCVGRLDPPKGVEVLLDAMAVMKQNQMARSPILKIAGTGHNENYVQYLRNRVSELNLADNVEFLGNVASEQIPELYKGALFSVLPALWFENLPNSLLESFACGKPVVASNIGSLARTISDGVDGLLFRPGDVEDLADKIRVLIMDRELRGKLSRNCRETAVKQFSPQAHMKKLMSLFEQLANSAQRVI